jgi:LCP family protein required for cell wall assembly
MTEWPDEWFRDSAASADPTVQRQTPVAGPGPGAAGQRSPAGEQVTQPRVTPNFGGQPPAAPPPAPGLAGPAAGRPASPPENAGRGWPEQPSLHTAGQPPGSPRSPRPGRGGFPGDSGGPGGPGPGGPGRSGWRRWLRPRRVIAVLAVIVSVALIAGVATYFYFDSKLVKKNVLVDYSGRPVPGAGQNWLITGSDSRQGLTRAQERKLATGHDISGMRSDTILVLHLPANGQRPVLISLPRDSWVPIPGHGDNKINAAYSFGGPKLLARTVQDVTGLYINHYMGIGFGGFVHVVNAVGGVRICLKQPLHDPSAGLHLRAGCQVLDGAQALGYVRSRHNYATQDLQRIQNQRVFLRALLRKLTSASILADPFRALPAASGVVGTLTVDQGTSLEQLLKVAFALRNPITTTVPIANSNYVTPTGEDAVLWNKSAALTLFHEIEKDQPVSKSLITGSHPAG